MNKPNNRLDAMQSEFTLYREIPGLEPRVSSHESRGTGTIKLQAVGVLALLLLGACARVGAPLPPLKRQPPAVAGLTTAQEGGDLILRGQLPAANTDKSPITRYHRLEVAGAKLPSGSEPAAFEGILLPVGSWEDTVLALHIDADKRRFEVRIPLRDRFVEGDGTVGLQVRFQNDRQHWSPWSALAVQPVGRIALPPGKLTARVDGQGIHLAWVAPTANVDGSHPASADGVLLLRRQLPDGPEESAGEAPAPATSHTIAEYRPDSRYALAAAPFRRIGAVVIRGSRTPWIEVDTQDVYAPPPPSGLAAVLEDGKIRLIWDPAAAPDLAGYLVYRADAAGGEAVALTPAPVADPSFLDGTANPDAPHWYRVVAVDRRGNRSERSAEVAYEPAKGHE